MSSIGLEVPEESTSIDHGYKNLKKIYLLTSLNPCLDAVSKSEGEGGKNIGFGKVGKAKDKGISGVHVEKRGRQI
jgi:hypothetical protein